MWGLTTSMTVIANTRGATRGRVPMTDQRVMPAAMKDRESLPNAEDQKLMEGRKTISVANRRISRDLSAQADCRLASKACRPIVPNMLKSRQAPRKDRFKP